MVIDCSCLLVPYYVQYICFVQVAGFCLQKVVDRRVAVCLLHLYILAEN